MTDHQLYLAAKQILTIEELNIQTGFKGDKIFKEVQNRKRLNIWRKAGEDAFSIASSISNVYELYPNTDAKIISLNRIDFCNPQELSTMLKLKPKEALQVLQIVEEDYFSATVKGDSMIDAKIHPNDTVVIEKTDMIDDDSVVLVSVENKHLIKRISYQHDCVILNSDNPKHAPMYFPFASVEVFGVVRFSITSIK